MAAKQEHEAVSLYRLSCSWTPAVTSATILRTDAEETDPDSSKIKINSCWSQRDLTRSKKVTFDRTDYCTTRPNGPITANSHSISRTGNIVMKCYSDSGLTTAYVVSDKAGGEGKEQQYIEIWTKDVCWKVVDLKDFDLHEDIVANDTFGVLSFSPDERFLLYVAEKKKAKSRSFFDQSKKDSKEGSEMPDAKDAPSVGDQFAHSQTWGEQFVGVTCPVMVVCSIHTDELQVIDTAPFTDMSVGQPQWSELGQGIVFVGWDHKPRKHGIIYCSNRRSALYHYSFVTKRVERLTPEVDRAVYSPRIVPRGDYDTLVYLCRPADGPHWMAAQLCSLNLVSREKRVLVDIVDAVETADQFPGLYTLALPRRCWNEAGTRLYLHSMWRSRRVILCIDEKSDVNRVSPADPDGSWIVHDVDKDCILASFSNPAIASKLMCARLPDESLAVLQNWTKLAVVDGLLKPEDIEWRVLTLQPDDTEDPAHSYEAILLTPRGSPARCLAVCPHGGPHSVYSVESYFTPSIMVKMGYAVLLVNYRGSIGFGQAVLEGLCGRAGAQDVRDVQQAARAALAGDLGRQVGGRVVVWGGSHGGFLAAHLIGQYPAFYRAACMRNPVINVVDMTVNSDIPDWAHVEAGIPYTATAPPLPSADVYGRMLACSPIRYVAAVATPVMLQLGDSDLRVPPGQALHYFHTLQGLGKEARLLMYPGNNHPLNKVDAEGDCFVNMMLWFEKHLSGAL